MGRERNTILTIEEYDMPVRPPMRQPKTTDERLTAIETQLLFVATHEDMERALSEQAERFQEALRAQSDRFEKALRNLAKT